MKKLILLILAIMTVLCTSCAQKDTSEELNIYTWAGYVPDEAVLKFEQETGIKVNYANFTQNEEVYAKLKANNAADYDIVICSDYIIDLMRNEGGLLKELDTSKIENYGNIDQSYQNKYYDPENKYTVPYAGASAIIVYDSDKVPFEITGYGDLWDERLKDELVLVDGDRDVIGFTLQKMGKSLNETDEAVLRQAGEELKRLKPNVVGFNGDTPHDMIISGDASVGYMYGSQAVEVMKAVSSAKIAYPKEGMGFYIDNVVVPLNAPNSENAYKFINFILDGENSASISSSINYMNTNTAAKEHLPQEYLENETVNIPAEILSRAEVYKDIGGAREIYGEIWTEFKATAD